jgi:hypothetical protein
MNENERILYHYTSINGLLGIIESKSIWAANVLYLNDASELNYSLELLKDEIHKFINGISNALSHKHIFFDRILQDIPEWITSQRFAFFVSSFSEEGDLLSQWRGYCPGGIGFSLGFQSNRISEWCSKQRNCTLKPCIYDENKQRKELRILIDKLVIRYEKEMTNYQQGLGADKEIELAVDFLLGFIKIAPTFKHPKFKEENEWRIIKDIFLRSQDEPILIKYRKGNSMVVPYIEIPLPSTGEIPFINKVIVGPTRDPILSKASIEMLLKSHNVKFDKVEYSTIPYRNW